MQPHLVGFSNSDKRNVESEQKFTQIKLLLPFEALTTRKQAGQDHIIYYNLPNLTQNQMIFGVFDGHGLHGHYYSYIASSILFKHLEQAEPNIRKLITNQGDNFQPATVFNTIFQDANQEIKDFVIEHQIDTSSGSTASIAMVLEVEIHGLTKRCLITANAGDSPIVYSHATQATHAWSEPEPEELSQQHNCDNLEVVQQYVNRCRQIGLTPHHVFYIRNYPLQVYNYNLEGKVTLNKANYETMSQWYPHGVQSKHYPETYRRELDGRIQVKPGQEHLNWGSSLNHKSQVIHGLGDFDYHPHHSCLPHTTFRFINQETKLFLASDGTTDLCKNNDLINFIHLNHHQDASTFTKKFQHFLCKEAITPPEKPIGHDPTYDWDHDHDLPKWDDVSYLSVYLPPFTVSANPEKIRQIKQILSNCL